MRAWRASYPIGVGTFKAYLFLFARNLQVDGRRRDAGRGDLAGEPVDPAPGPDESSARRRELRAVLAALQQLTEIDRAALLLRTLEELPYETIAAALNLSTAAARVKVHRARLKLAALRE